MKIIYRCTVCVISLLFSLSVFAVGSVSDIQAAINSDKRTAGESDRDAGRKPAEVLAFLGVKPGMTVLDVAASGGWYTEVLSFAVGSEGKVYAQNSPAFLQYRDGANEKAISARLANNRLPNVERINSEFGGMNIDNSVDVAITALNFHDIYNRSPEAGVAMLKDIKAALKPGGVLGLIDHNGKEGTDNNALHRMPVQQAIDAAKAAGFEVEVSDILANSEDDGSALVFAPGVRGKTDRFLLKLTKK
ncbi:class I SAM-dependent methyltransferase [Aurantivibrio infirmus]